VIINPGETEFAHEGIKLELIGRICKMQFLLEITILRDFIRYYHT